MYQNALISPFIPAYPSDIWGRSSSRGLCGATRIPPPRGLMGIFIGAFWIWAPSRLSSRVTRAGTARGGMRASPAYHSRRAGVGAATPSRQLGGLRAPDAARSGAALSPRCPRWSTMESTARRTKPDRFPFSLARAHPSPAAPPRSTSHRRYKHLTHRLDGRCPAHLPPRRVFLHLVHRLRPDLGGLRAPRPHTVRSRRTAAPTPPVFGRQRARARRENPSSNTPCTPAEEGRAPRFAARHARRRRSPRASRHASHAARRARSPFTFVRARTA